MEICTQKIRQKQRKLKRKYRKCSFFPEVTKSSCKLSVNKNLSAKLESRNKVKLKNKNTSKQVNKQNGSVTVSFKINQRKKQDVIIKNQISLCNQKRPRNKKRFNKYNKRHLQDKYVKTNQIVQLFEKDVTQRASIATGTCGFNLISGKGTDADLYEKSESSKRNIKARLGKRKDVGTNKNL